MSAGSSSPTRSSSPSPACSRCPACRTSWPRPTWSRRTRRSRASSSATCTGTTSTTASSGRSSSCAPAPVRSTSARSSVPRTSSRSSTTSRSSSGSSAKQERDDMSGISPLDEFPLHQAPLPLAWANSSDRNFYDRSYFNAHDRTGDIMVITGLGYYPNLGTKDAFVLVSRNGKQTAVHLSDVMDQDRLNPHVGNYRVEVADPLKQVRIVLEETDGIAAD